MNEKLKKIAVISDTHNRVTPALLKMLRGVEYILHAGDICTEDIVDELKLIAPVTACLGNNDFLDYPDYARISLNGVKFVLHHYPCTGAPPDSDWYIFGHTHVPYDKMSGKVRLFNPGSASMNNKGAPRSAAILEWRDDHWEPTLHLL